MGSQGLQRHLYKSKIRTKIQNVKPNKPPVARKTLGLKCEEPFGGHPPTTADHVLLSPLYLSQWSKLQNLVKILFPRLIFQPLSWEPIHAHHNNIWNYICTYWGLKIYCSNNHKRVSRTIYKNIKYHLFKIFYYIL